MLTGFEDGEPLVVESTFAPTMFEESVAEVTLQGTDVHLWVETRALRRRVSTAFAAWNTGFSTGPGVVCTVFAVSGAEGSGSAVIGAAAGAPFLVLGEGPIDHPGWFADPPPRPADLWTADGGPGHIDRRCSTLKDGSYILAVGIVGSSLAGGSYESPGWARLDYRQTILRAEAWLCSRDDEALCTEGFAV